jgi:hypothetical protein
MVMAGSCYPNATEVVQVFAQANGKRRWCSVFGLHRYWLGFLVISLRRHGLT